MDRTSGCSSSFELALILSVCVLPPAQLNLEQSGFYRVSYPPQLWDALDAALRRGDPRLSVLSLPSVGVSSRVAVFLACASSISSCSVLRVQRALPTACGPSPL